MKNVRIRKGHDLSAKSKVFVNINSKKVHLKGFDFGTFSIEPGEELYASQNWTRSRKIGYEQLEDGSTLLVKPRIGKLFAFITIVVFSLCLLFFLFTRNRWSFIPLAPFGLTALLMVSLLKNRYLKILPID